VFYAALWPAMTLVVAFTAVTLACTILVAVIAAAIGPSTTAELVFRHDITKADQKKLDLALEEVLPPKDREARQARRFMLQSPVVNKGRRKENGLL
jgi:hypothetical protein